MIFKGKYAQTNWKLFSLRSIFLKKPKSGFSQISTMGKLIQV